MTTVAASSTIAAATPNRRAGAASSGDTESRAAPAALAAALAPKTKGISARASDQGGIVVLKIGPGLGGEGGARGPAAATSGGPPRRSRWARLSAAPSV